MKLSRFAVIAATCVTIKAGQAAAFVGPRFAATPILGQQLHVRQQTRLPSRLYLKDEATEENTETSRRDQDPTQAQNDSLAIMNDKQQNESFFVNEGLFSWMTNFLFLHEDGKSMAYGIPLEVAAAADESKKASPDQIAKEKQELAANLMNIGWKERERRRNAGDVFTIITGVYVVWASVVADQGDLQGHILRFVSFLPLFFATGFKLAAKEGL